MEGKPLWTRSIEVGGTLKRDGESSCIWKDFSFGVVREGDES